MRARFTLAVACVLLATGCQKRLTEEECFTLLDKYVELLLESDRPGSAPPDRLKLKSEARAKANRDPAFAECSDRVSRSEFECAMQASNPDGLEQCLL